MDALREQANRIVDPRVRHAIAVIVDIAVQLSIDDAELLADSAVAFARSHEPLQSFGSLVPLIESALASA